MTIVFSCENWLYTLSALAILGVMATFMIAILMTGSSPVRFKAADLGQELHAKPLRAKYYFWFLCIVATTIVVLTIGKSFGAIHITGFDGRFDGKFDATFIQEICHGHEAD